MLKRPLCKMSWYTNKLRLGSNFDLKFSDICGSRRFARRRKSGRFLNWKDLSARLHLPLFKHPLLHNLHEKSSLLLPLGDLVC